MFKFIKFGPRSIWRICESEPRKFVCSDVTNETAELKIVTIIVIKLVPFSKTFILA